MFDKFGEFDSAEELNKAAAAQKAEGDLEALLLLAQENGIEKDDAEDYYNGYMDQLCNPMMAAIGKINVERHALDLPTCMEGWIYMLNEMLAADLRAEELALGIRKKNKKLTDLFGQLLEASSKNRKKVPDAIVKAAKLSGTMYVGDVDHPTFINIVYKFYL